MARKMTEWHSKRGPITKIMLSGGGKGDTAPLALGLWYDFHDFGCHLGNVGQERTTAYRDSSGPNLRSDALRATRVGNWE